MPLSSVTITGDIADQVGSDFDARRTKVYVTTNIPDGTVIDTDGNKIRLGSGSVTLNADGTFSASVWVPGTGSNPASWQTYFHVDYPDAATRGRRTRTFGPFTVTAAGDLADLVLQQEVPPTYLSTVTAQLDTYVTEAEAARDAAVDISNIDTSDGVVSALIEGTGGAGPLTRSALSASIESGVIDLAPALDGIDRTYTPAPGKTNGWEAIWDSATGYLLHMRTGASSTGDNAIIGIGTDSGSGNGILISHKNGGAGLRTIQNPGAGFGHYASSYGFNGPLYIEQYVQAGPVVLRRRTGQGFSDGVTTSGSTTFTSASASFSGADVGVSLTQLVSVAGTVPAGTIPDGTTIVSVTNATTVVLSAAATATTTGLKFRVSGRTPATSQSQFEVRDTDGTTVMLKIAGNGVTQYPDDATKAVLSITGKTGQSNGIFDVFIQGNATPALRVQSTGRVSMPFSASISNAGLTSQPAALVTNTATGQVTLSVVGVASQTADQVSIAPAGTLKSRFDANGTLMTRVTTAPLDAALANGECAWWFDSTSGAAKVMFKAKDAGGTVRTGQVALA